jgi:hypothetical protein
MAKGNSGRIVLEIDPEIKRNLYIVLAKNQLTLKDWFVSTADIYIEQNINSFVKEHSMIAECSENSYKIKPEKRDT